VNRLAEVRARKMCRFQVSPLRTKVDSTPPVAAFAAVATDVEDDPSDDGDASDDDDDDAEEEPATGPDEEDDAAVLSDEEPALTDEELPEPSRAPFTHAPFSQRSLPAQS
jgi:hypothetical protein